MKKNVGMIDRALRVLLGVAIGVMYYTGYITGTAAIVLGIVAVGLILSSLVSFCPAYKLIGLSTRQGE